MAEKSFIVHMHDRPEHDYVRRVNICAQNAFEAMARANKKYPDWSAYSAEQEDKTAWGHCDD